MRKIHLLLPLLVWLLLVLVELYSLFFQFPKPMFFRAWEAVINEGKDSYYVPFQPLVTYEGPMSGDLLLRTNFKPKQSEIRHQLFQADEYGFRNTPGRFSQGVDVVLMGTSFVGGAQETQESLVSEILTRKYSIPTYNYATLPLQFFWEDKRFQEKPPKIVVIIANETEVLQNTWVEVLADTPLSHDVPAWSSHDEWKKTNDPFKLDYEYAAKYLKRFSYIRYLSKDINRHFQNELYSREELASAAVKVGEYDPRKDIGFWDINSYDPRIDSSFGQAIPATIETLKKSQTILAKRNIIMIMAVVPAKSAIHSDRYKDIPLSQRSITHLQQEFDKNNIEYINVTTPILDYISKTGKLVYYPDDSHWNTTVNDLLSELLAKKIVELEKNI